MEHNLWIDNCSFHIFYCIFWVLEYRMQNYIQKLHSLIFERLITAIFAAFSWPFDLAILWTFLLLQTVLADQKQKIPGLETELKWFCYYEFDTVLTH